jgi:hypothetical protein
MAKAVEGACNDVLNAELSYYLFEGKFTDKYAELETAYYGPIQLSRAADVVYGPIRLFAFGEDNEPAFSFTAWHKDDPKIVFDVDSSRPRERWVKRIGGGG